MRIDCEGAPRDLGLDQGRAMGEGVDAELVRILRQRPMDGATRALGHDVERHFPHLSERMAGLAGGAHVERAALVMALARAAREPAFLFRPARALAVSSPLAPRAFLAGRFDLSADRCSMPLVRRSAPQGGYASLELTLPWLASSLGGVNAAGLSALLASPGSALPSGEGLCAEARCYAPALLFVQQCLERFDRVDTALDWCSARPSEGSASIFFADATGAVAGLELEDDRRRRVEPTGPGFLWRASGSAKVPAAFAPDGAVSTEAASLLALLTDGAARNSVDALEHRAYLRLDAHGRALEVVLDQEGLSPAGLVERFALESAEDLD